MTKIDKIEAELNYLDSISGKFTRTRLLVLIARLLFIIVQRGSVM